MLLVAFLAILLSVNTVRQAFDRLAPVYDQVFSGSKIRSEVWEIADRFLTSGMHVLDVGCGTGEDALHFAHRGVRITAIDIAPAMIALLKTKSAGTIDCEAADIRSYSPAGIHFDGVFSNFGALNCVPDLDCVRRLPLAPGSYLVLTTMGRIYPLESAVFLLKGKPRLAFRRYGREGVVEGIRFNVYYHGLRRLQRALGTKFDLIQVKGLRSIVPSPSLAHLERFSLFRALEPLDRWLCSHRLTATYADHFITVWRCREA
jgi:SAM-dependent methyltransferase